MSREIVTDTKGNRVFFRNLQKEKVLDYVKWYYGYDNFTEYEGYVVNTETGEVVSKIEYENGMYKLIAKDAA